MSSTPAPVFTSRRLVMAPPAFALKKACQPFWAVSRLRTVTPDADVLTLSRASLLPVEGGLGVLVGAGVGLGEGMLVGDGLGIGVGVPATPLVVTLTVSNAAV